jgi:GxxExxY protein
MPALDELNVGSGLVVDCAIEVHRALGPGLLESVYETCLAFELRERGCDVRSQQPLPLVYKTLALDNAYRIDLIVNDAIVVEVKTVERILPIHEAQLLTYLKLSRRRLGLLLNFQVPLLKDGIRRLLNGF